MTDPNLNALWCRALVEELVRAGVRRAVLCPGSRNSPLVFALAHALGDAAIDHIDERSAAFLALGMALADGAPTVVCVTSGSAVANLLPAFTEAAQAGVPLVALTADRPWEAHGMAAPQTMPQAGLLAPFAAALDLGEPDPACLPALRARVSAAVQRTAQRGPLQINIPLREPLPPLADPAFQPPRLPDAHLHGRADGAPWIRLALPAGCADLAPVQHLLRPGLRGMIVAGPGNPLGHAEIAALARATGFAVAADAPSGLRRPLVPHLLPSFDVLVQRGDLPRPEIVLRLGDAPIAKGASAFLAACTAPQIAITRDDALHDHTLSTCAQLVRPTAAALDELGDRLRGGDAAFTQAWERAEAQARAGMRRWLATAGWGEHLAAHLALEHPGFAGVHLASSLTVRLANLLIGGWPAAQAITCNRGVNGIDGTIATWIGSAIAGRGPALGLVGDLATLHDLPALAAARHARGALVVLNNGGGALFDFLPVSQVAGYRQRIRADHAVEFAGAATQFGLAYAKVRDAGALHAALDAAVAAPRAHLIECDLHGCDPAARQRELTAAMLGG